MKKTWASMVVVVAVSALHLLQPSEAAARTVTVTSSRDEGRGSFREAMRAASADPSIDRIAFSHRVDAITLESTVVYAGTQRLRIDGAWTHIGGAGAFDLVLSSGGARELVVSDLELHDGGARGLVVEVPASATGTIAIVLQHVALRRMAAEGLHVDERADGVGGGASSAASISLRLEDCVIEGNGSSPLLDDVDAIRVDEGAAGDISLRAYRTRVVDNVFDGIELDEQGDGSVDAILALVAIDGNGEGNAILGEPDDGFDVDEADGGDVEVSVWLASVNGNFDQGVDLDEAGDGSVSLSLSWAELSANGAEGAKVSESGVGDATIEASCVTFENDGDDAFQFEEADAGDVSLTAWGLTAVGNAKDGVKLDEAGEGSLHLVLRHASIRDNADDGVQLSEAGAGDIAADLSGVTSAGNASDGIKAKQASSGVGALTTASTSVEGNGGDAFDLTGVTHTTL